VDQAFCQREVSYFLLFYLVYVSLSGGQASTIILGDGCWFGVLVRWTSILQLHVSLLNVYDKLYNDTICPTLMR
jgi:hypothetical protein